MILKYSIEFFDEIERTEVKYVLKTDGFSNPLIILQHMTYQSDISRAFHVSDYNPNEY